jgi:hypothetical protein
MITEANPKSATAFLSTVWNGKPTSIDKNHTLSMSPTPVGVMVLVAHNESANNAGSLQLTSGGYPPVLLTCPQNQTLQAVNTQNWGGNPLTVFNNSPQSPTLIKVQAMGPGMPGITPKKLPYETNVSLSGYDCAAGQTQPNYMNLTLQTSTNSLTTFAVIGGMTGAEAYFFALNVPPNTPTQPGYFQTTPNSQLQWQFNWGGANIFIANLSATTAAAGTVNLVSLA